MSQKVVILPTVSRDQVVWPLFCLFIKKGCVTTSAPPIAPPQNLHISVLPSQLKKLLFLSLDDVCGGGQGDFFACFEFR